MTLAEFLLARIAEVEAMDRLDHEWMYCECGWTLRVLAECESKRGLLELHAPDLDWPKPPCSTCAAWADQDPYERPPMVAWPCPTLRVLALPYADHPDYEEDWRP